MLQEINPDEAIDVVRRDVIEVLEGRLARRGEGFALGAPFTTDAPPSINEGDPIDVRPLHDEGGTIHAVPWSWTGIDNDVERRGLFGLGNTDEEVTVRGVTFVTRVPATEDNPDGYQLYRYIDWLDVFRQAGIGVSTRPIYDYRKNLSEESLEELNNIPELAEAYRTVAEREVGG